MANHESDATNLLRDADLTARAVRDLNPAERAELNRRFDSFVRHFRAGKLASAPSVGASRRIRKWMP